MRMGSVKQAAVFFARASGARMAKGILLTQVTAGVALAQAPSPASIPDFQTYLPELQRLYQAQDWTNLERLSRQVQSTMEGKWGPDAAPVGVAAAWLAMSLNAQSRLPEAESAARRSLAINERVLGPDNVNTTASLLLVSVVLQSERRLVEAEPLIERALASREKTLGAEDPGTAEAVVDLALLRQHLGNYEGAETLYRRALAIDEHRFGSDSPPLIVVLINLALLSQLEGRYADGETLARRAYAIAVKTRGPDHPTTADVAGVLASLLQSQGRYTEAEALFRQSLATYEKAYGAEAAIVATALNGLASMFMTQGRFAEAEPLFRRALAMREKLLGPDSPKTAVLINNLAVLMTGEGRFPEAEALNRRMLAIAEKALGPDDMYTAGNLNNLATSLRFEGKFDEAEALQRRALAIVEKKLGPDAPDTLLKLNNLGNLLYYAGHYAQAEPLLRRALATAEKTLGPENPTTTSVHSNLALIDAALGKFEDAARNDRAGCSGGQARANTSADGSGVAALANRTNASDCWLRLSLSLSRWATQGGGPAPVDRPEALKRESFLTSQRAVQSAAGDAMGRSAALAIADAAGVGTQAQAYEAALLERDALDQRYATLTGTSDAENLAKGEALARAHTELVARIEGLAAELKTKAPAFWDFRAPEPLSVSSLQAKSGPDAVLLTSDEALITFLVAPGKDTGLVFVVTKEEVTWARVGASGDDVSARVNALRRQIDPEAYGLTPSNATRAGPFDRQAAYELYQKLLGDPSVQAAIKDKPVLLFVPSGPLTSLPPALLVTAPPAAGPGSDPQALRATPWLIRSKAVAFLPAVNSLRTLRQLHPSDRRAATDPLLAFADPDFSRRPTGSKQPAERRNARGFSSYFRNGVPLADALDTLPSLPGTRIEGEALVKALAARPGSLLTGREASKAELMARNTDGRLSAVRVIEFATHGLVAGDASDLAEPALALAAGQTPADELLLASEAARLKLNADWVLLSACNTASPDAPAAQGLSGLSRAFFYAGAKSLLVSHWRVRDDVAPILIPAMLVALREHPAMTRAQALRQATLAILDDTELDAADPAAWAPFTLIGEAGH